MLNRAYSVLEVRSVDAERRVITGVATTPTPDRMGDIVDPLGIKYKNPLPLLLYHDAQRPVGTVKFAKPTADGVTFEAKIPEVSEPASLRERIEEAWASVKLGLVKGVSIGFRAINPEETIKVLPGGGWQFSKTEVLELSLVAIPANAEATIQTIKSLDAPHLAALGTGDASTPPAGATASRPVVSSTRKTSTSMAKSIAEQIKDFEATRESKNARLLEIQGTAANESRTKTAEEKEEFETLKRELKDIDEELVDLRDVEQSMIAKAAAPVGTSMADASGSRGGGSSQRYTASDVKLEKGIGFARYTMAKIVSYREHRPVMDIAKEMWPSHSGLHAYIKAAVPAGTTTQAVWASPLVDTPNYGADFIEYLRPQTIVGRIEGLNNIPFNVGVLGQTSGGDAWWVGQGAPKPLTSFAFSRTTLGPAKVANIAVITEELARFSSPSAERLVRDALAGALRERIDIDFVDPANAGSANVQPASITNGVTPLASAGATEANIRTDFTNLLNEFITNNVDPSSLVLIMPTSLAMALSVMTNSLGQPSFPTMTRTGGTLLGVQVIASQYVANQSGSGNMVIALAANELFLADDGDVRIDVSREASLQMLDNPTNNSASATATTMVSLWQTNSIGILAERMINWAKRRATAVSYMDDVTWSSVGSP